MNPPNPQNPVVYLVLLEFGQQHETAALDLLIPTLERVIPGGTIRGTIVDNALTARTETAVSSRLHRLNGDNAVREFSGWDRGLAWIERRHAPAAESFVVLANDTVVRPEKHDRVRDVPRDRVDAASRGALVGYVEAYPRPVTIFGLTLRQWADTSFVLASWRTLEQLRPLARPMADDQIFAGDWRAVFREPSPLSENYRVYLKTWLFGEHADAEFPHTWHACAPLTESNVESFKGKLRSLFCEHLLSARARPRGPHRSIIATEFAISVYCPDYGTVSH